MKVITGTARGRKLATLEGADITRPTTQSTKEALFSSIQFEIEDKKVLDLFAGCGQLGIEALSRGARHCTFVENNRQAFRIVEENVKLCRFDDRARLVFSDAVSFLLKKDDFDIAFLDPPYNKGLILDCLDKLTMLMNPDGVIICESARGEDFPEKVNDWLITKEKNYGKSKLTYYRKDKA